MAYQTIYPYTNEVLHTFDNMTDQGLADVLERAHLLYKKWRKEDHLEERKAQLHQVANILRRDRDKYAEIMTKDMGKLFTEAQGEVDLCADIADYYADKADEFLMSMPLETDSGQAYYLKQSTGVILAVEPWNFPYYQIMRVFAPNFIVGNPMVLKHASICPRSAQSFEELVLEAGAEAGSITNLFISYDQVSQVIADKRVVGVCLTGSERGGASIAEEAGKNLKKTTLELGGDDAFIILDDADWDQLEKVLYFSRLYNAGQVCTSSKRFIVLDKDYDRFKELLTKVFKTAKWVTQWIPKRRWRHYHQLKLKQMFLTKLSWLWIMVRSWFTVVKRLIIQVILSCQPLLLASQKTTLFTIKKSLAQSVKSTKCLLKKKRLKWRMILTMALEVLSLVAIKNMRKP